MSPGQVVSDMNFQEPETNKFDCPVDADGGMSFTLVSEFHYQIIDFTDIDLDVVVLAPGSQGTGLLCRSKHFMLLGGSHSVSFGLLGDRDDGGHFHTCENYRWK